MEITSKEGPLCSPGNSKGFGPQRPQSDVGGQPAGSRQGIVSVGNEMAHIRDTSEVHKNQDF